jgi:integrase
VSKQHRKHEEVFIMDKQKDTGKLPDLAKRLYEQLEKQHYRDATVVDYEIVVRALRAFMDERRLSLYSEEVGQRFLAFAVECRTGSFIKRAKPTVRRLDDVLLGRRYARIRTWAKHEVPDPFSAPLEEFLLMRRSSGIRETTLSGDRRYLESFLNGLDAAGMVRMADVGAHGIRLAVAPLRLTAAFSASIRRFLAFAYGNGYMAHDYSAAVPRPRATHSVPSTYSPDEVAAVLACVDRVAPVGKRDYAMLLLAARLGLRRSDILALKPENIDCGRNVITPVQTKTGEPLELPLLDEVKEALADYIQNARPDCTGHKVVFLGHMAPYEPLSREGLTLAVRRYFRRAGIAVRGRRQGPHALRASLATGMLAEDAPYDAIAKVLGHTCGSSTRSYIEIDIERLRACALEVPPPSGAFATLLPARAR